MTGAGRRHLFVGRGRELAELVALVDSAVLTRTPAVAVVVGEPGIGKSALFSRLAESVTGFRVLQVAGSSAVPALPFVAAEPLLRNLAGGQQSGSLAQLLAEPQQDSSLGTLRVIEAAYVAAARIGAVLVCVDDLQWVDESSIALLQSLIRGASTARLPLVVVAATRTGGIGEQRASTLMADLPSEQCRLLELRGLDDEAAGELAAALLGPARAASGPDVAARAAGSPFWIWQMASQPDSDDRSAVVTSRLRSATGDAAEVLALVAVAGRPVTPAELAELQSWPTERSAEAVERLRTLGLLTDELAGVRLAHDLWRSAVEQLLPAATKRRCHRQLARWLQERADGDVATVMEALGHATKAGDDPADLLPLVLGSPARRMVGQEGLRMLADVVTKSAPRHAAATATLATELGDELVAAPLWELAALSTSRRDRVAARLGAATTAYRLGREDATDLLQAARAELTREDVDLAATADALEASLLCWDRHRPQEALELVRTARHRLAAGVGTETDESRSSLIALLAAEHGALTVLARDDEAIDSARLRARVAAADHRARRQAAADEALSLMLAGRLSEAVDSLDRLVQEARRFTLPGLELAALRRVVVALYRAGALQEAADRLVEAQELAFRCEGASSPAASTLRRHELSLALHRDRWRDALREWIELAVAEREDHERLGDWMEIVTWASRLESAVAGGSLEQYVGAGRDLARSLGCRRCGPAMHLTVAEAMARTGRAAEACAALAEFDAAQPPPSRAWVVRRGRAAAWVAAATGQAGAVDQLTEVLEQAREDGRRLDEVWAGIDLATVMGRTGPDAAIPVAAEAARLAGVIGATTEEEVAGQALRAWGVRTWQRGRATAGAEGALAALTPRERQVATMVATGASNPEVAAALFLSVRTVERHLAQIFVKLGLRNRTELAAAISSRD